MNLESEELQCLMLINHLLVLGGAKVGSTGPEPEVH